MNRCFVRLCAAIALNAAVTAQCFQPAGGNSIGGSLIPMSAGTPAHDQGRSPLTSLGMSFPMPASGSYTHCVIESNGLIYLANGVNPPFLGFFQTGSLSTLAGYSTSLPRIAPYWRDLQAMPSGWDITTQTVPGSSFKVNWINTTEYLATGSAKSFSATLHAGGAVEYAYDNIIVETSTFVGISVGGGVGASASPSDFSASPTGGTLRLMYESFNSTNFDLSNKTIRFAQNGVGGWDVTTPCSVSAASHTAYGAGCYLTSDSVYQWFFDASTAVPALSNRSITFQPTGPVDYLITAGGAFRPVGSVATPIIVANGTNVAQTVPFTVGSFPGSSGLSICSNGHVALAAGNDPIWFTNVGNLLNAPQRHFRFAHYFNPTIPGSGRIKYEESATVTVITWDGVWHQGGTSVAHANTFQMQFYPSGVVTIAWGSLSSGATGSSYLVGFSPGGPSQDDGSINLMGSLPYVHAHRQPLTLAASPNPVLGSTVVYTTTNLPASAQLAAQLVSYGVVNPGIDLGFLGAPGCRQNVNLTLASTSIMFGNPTATYSLALPGNPAFAGLPIYFQSAALVPSVNALGLQTSNGVRSVLSLY